MLKHGKRRIGLFLVGIIVAVLGFSAIVMVLWNLLMPQIFNTTTVTYWQAMGLFVLAHVLVKGGRPFSALHGMKHERWRRLMDEKICGMTPEQRKAFFADWEHRFHASASGDESSSTPA